MNRIDSLVRGLVTAVPTAVVLSLVLGILDDHLAWPVALAIAFVPGALSGLAAYYLYLRMTKKPWRW